MDFTKNTFDNTGGNKLLGQQPYVDDKGELVKPKDNKKMYIIIGAVAFIILLFIIIVIVMINVSKNNKCNSVEKMLQDAGYNYATDKGLLPSIIEEPVTLSASDLIANGYLSQSDFMVGESFCSGTVKLTNVGDDYIKTVNITGCDYCTTDTRYGTNWSNETSTKPRNGAYDVVVYYNYVDKSTHTTEWTKLYTPKQLENNPVDSYDDSRFPNIPSDAKNIIIEEDSVTYYRYRDLKWKFYKNKNDNYSALSCEQPSGYSERDRDTSFNSEYTEWSLTAPEEKDCRHVDESTGYRWYKVVDGEKIYWNSGAYYPTNPDEENESYTKDKTDSAKMWRYYETLYRWYNGDSRKYSSYMSVATDKYPYKDADIYKYGTWSLWDTTSSVNKDNSYYRNEITEVRKRFRLKYDKYSMNKLSSFVMKSDFAGAANRTLEEVYNDSKSAVIIDYKYIVRRK